MDSRFQVLPPLKRFRLLQQQGRDDEFNGTKANSFCLPTKKRKESIDVPVGETTTCCLPAKKRIGDFDLILIPVAKKKRRKMGFCVIFVKVRMGIQKIHLYFVMDQSRCGEAHAGDSKWAHLVFALLAPEVFFRDPEGREMIDCSRVPDSK
ncbi:hypothetical protein F3Y22_tig00110206pilonHSYRG00195 [Hibiscus syriacus]|uniref:Uncharacterized protein n=1 Tax=Hibiscus syriacus TaxID=106335 RepID=A0A6A3BC44_HIBSY|nr:hypothetical protein F3Y22_tig00110206pilonHSYRG00195 [Hibiscus syriacus]